MRRLRMALVSLLCAALLAACAKVPTREVGESAPVPAPTNTVTTIRVFTFGGGQLMDALISAYYAKYPNDRVEKVSPQMTGGVIRVSDVLKEKAAAGEIDVFISFGPIPMLVKENLVLPLDPYIQRSNVDLKPFGPGLESLRTDGKLYQLPYAIQPQVLIYNKTLFQAAGVEVPKRGWTWDDLRTTASRLTKGEGPSKVWGFAPTFPENMIDVYLSQWGRNVMEVAADEARVKEALQLFGTMVQTDKSWPAVGLESDGQTAQLMEFRQGKAAMTIDNLTSLKWMFGPGDQKFEYDVAPIPTAPGAKTASIAHPQNIGIVANTKQPDAAWRFVQFVAGPEGAVVVAKAGDLPLYRTPEVKNAWFSRQPAPPPGTEVLFETVWDFPPPMNAEGQDMTLYGTAFAALYRAMQATLSGEKSWEEAFAGYQQELKRIRAESKGS